MKAKYIPNVLSAIRIILVFVFAAVFFLYPDKRWIALIIFVTSGVTDVIDGRLARRNNWVTQLGKILDPVADKMMQCSVLLCAAVAHYVPWWIFVFYAAKELLMAVGSVMFFKRSREIGMSMRFGKFSVVLFYVVIGLMILLGMLGVVLPVPVFHALPAVTAIVAILSMVFYYRAYLKAEEDEKKKAKRKKAGHSDPGGEADSQ